MPVWKAVTSLMNAFETKLNKRYPKAYQMYMRIKTGSTLFSKETMIYFKVRRHYANTHNLDKFTWKDIMIYKQMPKHWRKIMPVFLLSLPPVLNYIVFPVAFMFPDKLLTPQFWTLEEKLRIYDNQYKKSLMHLKVDLLRHLSSKNETTNNSHAVDTETTKVFIDLMNKFKNQEKVDMSLILDFKTLFIKFPFDLQSLTKEHLKDLATFYNCNSMFRYRSIRQLERYAFLMSKVDDALPQTLESVDIGDLYKLTFQRGLNPINRDRADLEKYLKECQQFSSSLFKTLTTDETRKHYYSLFLHAVVLASYSYTLHTK